MIIEVWHPGERGYNSVDVNVGDEVVVKTWSGSIYGGTVSSVNNSEMSIKDVIEKATTAIFTQGDIPYNKESMDFNLDNVYGIDIVLNIGEHMTFESVKCLPEGSFNEFLDRLNTELDPVKRQYTAKVYNGMVEKYQQFEGYKKMANNIMMINHKMTFVEIVDKCLTKVISGVKTTI